MTKRQRHTSAPTTVERRKESRGPLGFLSPAARIAGLYFLFAGIWIKVSDRLLGFFIEEPESLVWLSILKGLAFVTVTTLLLYFLVRRSFRALQDTNHSLRLAEDLARGKRQILEMVATEAEAAETLKALVGLLNRQVSGAQSLILLPSTTLESICPDEKAEGNSVVDVSGLRLVSEPEISGFAKAFKEPLVLEDLTEAGELEDFQNSALPKGSRAFWSVPIFGTSEVDVLGGVAVCTPQAGRPDPSHLRLLDMAAHIAAVALEQERSRVTIIRANRELEAKVEARTHQLKVALERAEAADKIKSAFLATMSHELRTPLNSIIGFSGILLQGLAGPLNVEQEKQLSMVASSSRHLLALINDVLDISKIEAGQLTVGSRKFNLKDSIGKVFQTTKPLAEQKGLDYRLHVPDELGEFQSDSRRFEQILLNLLSNAIKFTEEGEVVLRVEIKQPEPDVRDNQELEISVVDTGIGIRPEDQVHLFRAFTQIDTGLTRLHEGTGLGLAICDRLIKLMGGRIEMSSAYGKGSTFTVIFPYPATSTGVEDPLIDDHKA